MKVTRRRFLKLLSAAAAAIGGSAWTTPGTPSSTPSTPPPGELGDLIYGINPTDTPLMELARTTAREWPPSMVTFPAWEEDQLRRTLLFEYALESARRPDRRVIIGGLTT